MGKPLSQTELTAAIVVPIFFFILFFMVITKLKFEYIIQIIYYIIYNKLIPFFEYIKNLVNSNLTLAIVFWVISFCLMFIFSFLLGFKKVDDNVGIPIIVIFGFITMIPILQQIINIINNMIGFITNIGNTPSNDKTNILFNIRIDNHNGNYKWYYVFSY